MQVGKLPQALQCLIVLIESASTIPRLRKASTILTKVHTHICPYSAGVCKKAGLTVIAIEQAIECEYIIKAPGGGRQTERQYRSRPGWFVGGPHPQATRTLGPPSTWPQQALRVRRRILKPFFTNVNEFEEFDAKDMHSLKGD